MNARRDATIPAGVLALLLVTAARTVVPGQEPAPPRGAAATRPGGAVEDKTQRDFGSDCLRSGCHAGLRSVPEVHGPVAVGACQYCHAADGAEKDHKFKPPRPKESFCSFCHLPPKPGKSVHKVFADGDCTSCHNPHGGETRAMLVSNDDRRLCKQCHDSKSPALPGASAPVGRAMSPESFQAMHIAAEDVGCRRCHMAHQSEFVLLLRRENASCLLCHNRQLTRSSGAVIRNVRDELANAKHQHEPVARGQCLVCHGPHSLEEPHLLNADYASDFYAEFNESAYSLCFSECHDRRLVTEERTTLTAFRDGTRNLHYVHVNRKKGRSCAICHDAHASELPALLRASVAFGPGSWELPIGFSRTESGGGCLTGCHKQLSYDNREPRSAEVSEEPRPPSGR